METSEIVAKLRGMSDIKTSALYSQRVALVAAADRLSEQQQVIEELASALELMLDSTADIRGIDVEFYCPIAFKAARNALSRAKEAGK